jgi:lysophospholipase L1-like esterase
MKRRHFAIPLLLLASMTIAACGRYSSNSSQYDPSKSDTEPSPETGERSNTLNNSNLEIVCWGDSMTAGTGRSKAIITSGTGKAESIIPYKRNTFDASNMSYPDVLHILTGMKTYNFGVPGATSQDIAILQGGISGSDSSYLKKINKDIVESGKKHPGDILILEIGSNGGWSNYNELIAQYNAMIDHSGCKDYIIIGDTDEPSKSADPLVSTYASNINSKDTETSWEKALKEAFGDHFVNMRIEMLNRGLSLAGLKETISDKKDADSGIISKRLRADWTHFNSYGYYSKAVILYEKGIELGYWK